MEIGGNENVEKKKSGRKVEKSKTCYSAEHSTIDNKVGVAFTIIFRM